MSTSDGGSAFPYENEHGVQHGLSIRDFFAAKAMAAIIPHVTEDFKRAGEAKGVSLKASVAQVAYQTADAMLIERAKVKA